MKGGRIVEARDACELGVAWFGDGAVPARVRVRGRDASLTDAVGDAADMLSRAQQPLVFLAPDLSCEAQREAVALADRLRGAIDSLTSVTSSSSLLAAQERGRAGATLGEMRHRADVLIFWGVDPVRTHPRLLSRYGPGAEALHLPDAGTSRTIVSVDVGGDPGPAQAQVRTQVSAADEVTLLTLLAGAVAGEQRDGHRPTSAAAALAVLTPVLKSARYIVLVADAEDRPGRDAGSARALASLAQSLNRHARCAAIALRGGGNRSGADAVLTSQTGYPIAIDFSRGYPRYLPFEGSTRARLGRGGVDAVLVLGSATLVPADLLKAIDPAACAVIGPRASDGPLPSARVVVDTGVPGIHEIGTALRMDDVPLPLRAMVTGPALTRDVVRAILDRLGLQYGGAA